jgi:SpoIVB peptidase S55
MKLTSDPRKRWMATTLAVLVALGTSLGGSARASEPDPKSYWDVSQIRPGMKGVGRTVMVGTKLEEFGAEVLGVMRDVSPGRDMVLCRLTGCNLEHAGIIQGMSGSPIYIDGKLLGAVAFAWEFAKDPIAGVTPFSQMIQYVRSNDRRIAAESKDVGKNQQFHAATLPFAPLIDGLGLAEDGQGAPISVLPMTVSGGAWPPCREEPRLSESSARKVTAHWSLVRPSPSLWSLVTSTYQESAP